VSKNFWPGWSDLARLVREREWKRGSLVSIQKLNPIDFFDGSSADDSDPQVYLRVNSEKLEILRASRVFHWKTGTVHQFDCRFHTNRISSSTGFPDQAGFPFMSIGNVDGWWKAETPVYSVEFGQISVRQCPWLG
jgi:hypothetical protein